MVDVFSCYVYCTYEKKKKEKKKKKVKEKEISRKSKRVWPVERKPGTEMMDQIW